MEWNRGYATPANTAHKPRRTGTVFTRTRNGYGFRGYGYGVTLSRTTCARLESREGGGGRKSPRPLV
jgi:hypothetical protein